MVRIDRWTKYYFGPRIGQTQAEGKNHVCQGGLFKASPHYTVSVYWTQFLDKFIMLFARQRSKRIRNSIKHKKKSPKRISETAFIQHDYTSSKETVLRNRFYKKVINWTIDYQYSFKTGIVWLLWRLYFNGKTKHRLRATISICYLLKFWQ